VPRLWSRLPLALCCLLAAATAVAGPPPPAGAGAPEPTSRASEPLVVLSAHLSSLRELARDADEECRPKAQAATQPASEPPDEPRIQMLDVSALAEKLAPREFRRHNIDIELAEIFPLGYLGSPERSTCGAPDLFIFQNLLTKGCLMGDRPDGGGFEFSLAYPLARPARLILGMQAADGGQLNRSELRTLIGVAVTF